MPQPSAADPSFAGGSPQPIHPPAYERSALRRSIVHIGVGGFHRAHFATYIDDLCLQGERGWSIIGAGVLEHDARVGASLQPQDLLYTMVVRGAATESARTIGSIVDFIHAWPSAERLIDQIADPTTQIVSLTVTEGGYPVNDRTGAFVPTSPNAAAGSTFAVLATALDRRRAAGGDPLTVLSFDNILGNGRATRTATVGAGNAIDPSLGDWIDQHVSFPNSMVDRITPTTSDHDIAALLERHGIADAWPVVTEPFRQWVVEDDFAGERLPLEQLDVIVTDDVEPYEVMKLRLLNAGHSCLAYLAALLGLETVDAALADAQIRPFLDRFLRNEARPVVPPVAGVDLDEYVASLLDRFSNPNIGDQIERLCLDGSAKFPKFLIPTIVRQVEAGGPVDLAALALAGWCEYLRIGSIDDATITPSADPLLTDATAYALASVDDPGSFLEFEAVFPAELRTGPFAASFTRQLLAIRERGVRSAIDTATS